jgi:ribosomal 50S subunit-recycling heat shock protein
MDNKGLDLLANAGYPSGNWEDMLVADGNKPLADDDGNIYSMTAYVWRNRPVKTRYVDAASIPYVVVNPIVRKAAKGIVLGCAARVTYKEKTIEAVVADVGPRTKIGEISVAAAEMLGIPWNPRTGGVESGVLYEIFPGKAALINGEQYDLQPA